MKAKKLRLKIATYCNLWRMKKLTIERFVCQKIRMKRIKLLWISWTLLSSCEFLLIFSISQFCAIPECRVSFQCPTTSGLGSSLRILFWPLDLPCLGRLDVWQDKEESISSWSKSCRDRRQTNRLADDVTESGCWFFKL